MQATKTEQALQNILYLIRVRVNNGDRVYVERNWDRAAEDEPDEALVRVFYNRFDAERYRESVAEYQMVDLQQVAVVAYTDLEEVFVELAAFDKKARELFGSPIRIDLSEMPDKQHPSTTETLFTAFAERH